MITNTIAYWRKSMNEGKGISQAHLARRIGVGRSFVTKLEKGTRQAGVELMFKLAEYFKQPIGAVFQHVDDGKAKPGVFCAKMIPIRQSVNPFRVGPGQADVKLTGHSTRPSGVDGATKGQIVGKSNGEGRGVTSRAVKPKEMK